MSGETEEEKRVTLSFEIIIGGETIGAVTTISEATIGTIAIEARLMLQVAGWELVKDVIDGLELPQ